MTERPRGDEVGRGRQAAEARPDDDDVDAAAPAPARGARRPGRAERRPGHERRAARDRLPARQRPVVAHPCSSRCGPCRRHPSMPRRATATGGGAARASVTLAAAMEHTAEGYWVQEAGRPSPAPRLRGTTTADVAVVGGGYLGLWTAWHVLRHAPGARVVVLEAAICGTGPSGRNGGFVNGLWDKAPTVLGQAGPAATADLLDAAQASVDAIGAWCDEQGVDAWFRRAAHLEVATSAAQEEGDDGIVAACEAVGRAGEVLPLTAAEVARACRSPVFGGGLRIASAATVQPARLAFGLRDRVRAAGAVVHEGSRVRRVVGGPAPRVLTDGGEVRAGAVVLAVNHARAGPTLRAPRDPAVHVDLGLLVGDVVGRSA